VKILSKISKIRTSIRLLVFPYHSLNSQQNWTKKFLTCKHNTFFIVPENLQKNHLKLYKACIDHSFDGDTIIHIYKALSLYEPAHP
jgi:hypothetical protein